MTDWTAIGTVCAGASMVISVGAAFWSRSSATSARESARIAKDQLGVDYVALMANQEPPARLSLTGIEFRWDGEGRRVSVPEGGEHPMGEFNELSRVTRAAAVENDLNAEIIISGELVNALEEEQLVTVRNHRTGVWFQLANEALFLVAGKNGSNYRHTLAPGESLKFRWIDRHNFDDWIAFFDGVSSQAVAAEYSDFYDARTKETADQILHRFGFDLSVENRRQVRATWTWFIEPATSALSLAGRDEWNQLQWKLTPSKEGPLDDDTVRYRYQGSWQHSEIGIAVNGVKRLWGRD